jgi:hypothetical protein
VIHNRVLAIPHIGELPHSVRELGKVSIGVACGSSRRGGSQAYDWSNKPDDYDMIPLFRYN